MSSNQEFLNTRMAEFMDAKDSGDSQALQGAFASALNESTGTVTERLEAMTAAIENAKNR